VSGTEEQPLRILQLAREENVLHIMLENGATYEVAPSAPEFGPWQVGDRLDAQAQLALHRADERKRVAKAALRLLGRKSYPSAGLREKLVARGLAEVAVDAVIAQLHETGLLNDVRYAEAYARTQLSRRPVSRRWLSAKLVAKGVDSALAWQGIEAVLPAAEEEALARRALARRHGRLDDQAARNKAMRFLMSRGFSRGLSTRVVLSGGASVDEYSDY